VHFDPNFTHVISVMNFEDSVLAECDHFRNLFAQYGPVVKVRIINRGRKVAFVTMSNGFYARVALTFLQNLKLDGRSLTFEFSFYSDLQNGSELAKEYQNDDDVDLEEYGAMWFPSEFVLVKPFDVPVEQLGIGPIIKHPRASTVQFRTVDDATKFIALHNNAKLDGKPVFLRFTNLSD
jgi:RNA recognition motif-containing protein